MKYISVCSGIEAASVAWHELGWEPVAFSEIEPFPSEVLKTRFPYVPNWGDMTNYKNWPDATINLLVGGTPCQSFSVAGLRQGLKDPRGNLMLTFLAIAERYKPRWIVWENVPGVLSSNGGKDFGSFLGALGELGYGWAYRVLDAQWFGVAQRRRRVFVVGCLGDQRAASEVLFESESVSRNPAPSREKRQAVAPSPASGVGVGGEWWDGGQTASTVTTRSGGQYMPDKDNFGAVLTVNTRQFLDIQENVTGTLLATDHKEPQAVVIDRAAFNQGENAQYEPKIEESETMPSLVAKGPHAVAQPISWDTECNANVNMMGTLTRGGEGGRTDGVAQPITIDRSSVNMGYDFNRDLGIEQSGVTPTILATGPHSVAQYYENHPADSRVTGPHDTANSVTARYGTGGGNAPLVAHAFKIRGGSPTETGEYGGTPGKAAGKGYLGSDDLAFTIAASQDQQIAQQIPFRKSRKAKSQDDFETWKPDQVANTLNLFDQGDIRTSQVVVQQPIAVDCYNQTVNEHTTQTIGSSASDVNHYGAVLEPNVSPTITQCKDSRGGSSMEALDEISAVHAQQPTMAIRRLTPVECERLQGFPRNWTLIPWKKKPIEECPDGPRYKACGNSMAVPCMRWIGKRIADAQAKIQ